MYILKLYLTDNFHIKWHLDSAKIRGTLKILWQTQSYLWNVKVPSVTSGTLSTLHKS